MTDPWHPERFIVWVDGLPRQWNESFAELFVDSLRYYSCFSIRDHEGNLICAIKRYQDTISNPIETLAVIHDVIGVAPNEEVKDALASILAVLVNDIPRRANFWYKAGSHWNCSNDRNLDLKIKAARAMDICFYVEWL